MLKILVLKLGYSETFDVEEGRVVSLGDVLRCSVILEPLKEKYVDSQITWLVSEEALPLIKGNPFIDRILVWDEFLPFALMREQYDVLVNLEKLNGICALADMINAWERVGFRFNAQTGNYDTYWQSISAKKYIEQKGQEGCREPWQKLLLEMIGCEWRGQRYSLGYKPKNTPRFDVGLNYLVGSKWPTKAMSVERWKELASRLERAGYSVSWQQGMNNLYEYMEWLASCRMVITQDSLGMHILLAMRKPCVALFGATDSAEVYLYDQCAPIVCDEGLECMPCYRPKCDLSLSCMDRIGLENIENAVHKILMSNKE